VQAAGGLVERRGTGGRVEVLLVHRDRYDDWTFPKGKADPGETPAGTARREVEEETGYACAVGEQITEVRYVDQRGRPKVVRYFRMVVERGSFVANDEVDAVAWCTPAEAVARLSYPHDVEVLRAAGHDV
jgi:8-oxo-dGTP diphosphatase